jgi:ABC-type sugar transport system ATPase subunit
MTRTIRAGEIEMSEVTPAIEIESVSKSYGGIKAVDDVSLAIAPAAS